MDNSNDRNVALRPHTDTEWELMKQEIKHLYIDRDLPLHDVVAILSKENGFHTK